MGYTLEFGSREFGITFNLDPFLDLAFEDAESTNADSFESDGQWWQSKAGSRNHGLWKLNDKNQQEQIEMLRHAIPKLQDIEPDDSWGGGEGGARRLLEKMLILSMTTPNTVWVRRYW